MPFVLFCRLALVDEIYAHMRSCGLISHLTLRMEVMTPEERFQRIERVLGRFAVAGRKARSEWRLRSREQDEKINILIHTQMETSEQMARNSERVSEQIAKMSERVDRTSEQIARMSERVDRTSEHIDKLAGDVATNHAIHNKEMADLRKSQELTDKALRAFIDDSLRKRRTGDSSD